jgi:hypothetical protein
VYLRSKVKDSEWSNLGGERLLGAVNGELGRRIPRRGFRMAFRDEPWQQYLKDHPDLTPPDLAPPQKDQKSDRKFKNLHISENEACRSGH